MVKTIRILILEDDLQTLSKLFEKLAQLENKYADEGSGISFSTVVLSEYTQVEELINKNPNLDFDIILLDRDCKAGGSFHILDIKRFGADKIIGISSVPNYNAELRELGVKKIVDKDYQDLDTFALKVINLVDESITHLR